MRIKITHAELVAVAEKSADALTERRVLAAALEDVQIRRRLALLEAVAADTSPLPPLSRGQQGALQEELSLAARRVGREFIERQAALTKPPPRWLQQLGGTLRQLLTQDTYRLNLPALAPALAASTPPLSVQREVIETERIRVEVHQLPDDPPRLRFLLDASTDPEFLFVEGVGVVLALQEEGSLEVQILRIPLNAQGRGILEIPVPVVRGVMSLIGVALVTD